MVTSSVISNDKSVFLVIIPTKICKLHHKRVWLGTTVQLSAIFKIYIKRSYKCLVEFENGVSRTMRLKAISSSHNISPLNVFYTSSGVSICLFILQQIRMVYGTLIMFWHFHHYQESHTVRALGKWSKAPEQCVLNIMAFALRLLPTRDCQKSQLMAAALNQTISGFCKQACILCSEPKYVILP